MNRTIEEIEKRFKNISNLNNIDLIKSTIKQEDYSIQQTKTVKEKSKQFGEVFTPIFLVDQMIDLEFNNITPETKTCDLCAGYGQYTIRLMRKIYNKFHNNINDWLKNSHTITELQEESCAKLVYIFGTDINLYSGDSLMLKYSDENDSGILFFNEKTKKWSNNQNINKLLEYPLVYNNIRLLTFIFKYAAETDKLIELNRRIQTALNLNNK